MTITSHPPRRLCATGLALLHEWEEAMLTHNRELIYRAMKAFFNHKNGLPDEKHRNPCWECICGEKWP